MKRETAAVLSVAAILVLVPASAAMMFSQQDMSSRMNYLLRFGQDHHDSDYRSSNIDENSFRSRQALRDHHRRYPQRPSDDATITELAVESNKGQFDVLIAALQATDQDDVLDARRGRFTVFAPTDRAFRNFFDVRSDRAAIRRFQRLDSETKKEVIRFHITPGSNNRGEVLRRRSLVSLDGEFRTTSQIRRAGIVQSNLRASNGYVHVIGGVLNPN